jgi:hypothetical protein
MVVVVIVMDRGGISRAGVVMLVVVVIFSPLSPQQSRN